MNDQKLDKKVRKDTERIQKDLRALAKDAAARLKRFEETVSKASGKANKELTSQVEGSVSHLSKGFDQATGNAARALAGTSAKLKKVVGHRFSDFSKQAQEAAVEAPKDLGKKVSRFPLMVITIALAVGFVLGVVFLPTRQPVEQVQA